MRENVLKYVRFGLYLKFFDSKYIHIDSNFKLESKRHLALYLRALMRKRDIKIQIGISRPLREYFLLNN